MEGGLRLWMMYLWSQAARRVVTVESEVSWDIQCQQPLLESLGLSSKGRAGRDSDASSCVVGAEPQ